MSILEVSEGRQSEDELLRRNQQLAAAAEVARVATSTLELDAVLTASVELIREKFGFYHASVFLIESESGMVVLGESTGEAGRQLKAKRHQLSIGSKSLVGSATATRQPVIVQDVTHDPTHFKNPLLPDTRAEAVIPLISGDTVVGALDVQSTTLNAFRPWDVTLLITIADQLTIAIQNAELYTSARKELGERKKAEQALQEIKDALEIRVEERTADLRDANEKLQSELAERKRVEAELEKSLSTLQATLEATADGILVVDLQENIISFNRRFLDMWHIPDMVIESRDGQKVLAFVLDQLVDPEDFQTKVRNLYKLPNEESNDILIFNDGRIFERHSRPQRSGDKNLGRVWSFRDVTESKQAEVALRESEARYRNLFEGVPVGVYRSTPQGKFLDVNEVIAHMFGYPDRDSLMNEKAVQIYCNPQDRQKWLDEMQSGDIVHHFEMQMRRLDGSIIWVRDSVKTVRDHTGRVLYFEGGLEDITERKQAEDKLRQAEEKYRNIFEYAVEGIYQTTPDGKYITANTALARMFGYRSAIELITSVPDLEKNMYVTPNRRTEFKRLLEEQDTISGFESEIYCKDGSTMWVSENARAVRDSQRTLLYYEGISINITERKRAEMLQEAVYQIGYVANQGLTLSELAATIQRSIQKVMIADNFYLAIYDPHAGVFNYPYFVDQFDEYSNSLPIKVKSMTAYVIRTGVSLLCTDAVHEQLMAAGEIEVVGVPSRIWLGVPLKIQGKVIGAMVVQDYQNEDAYGEREQQLLEYVSSQVATSIQRKQAEDFLRESEERYALAIRGANDGLWDWNLRSGEIYYSPRWKSMLGCREDEIDNNPDEWFSRIHPDDLTRVRADLDLHLEGSTSYFENEHRIRHAHGHYCWVLNRGLALRDENNRAYRMAGSQTDVTLRKQVEERLAHDALHDTLTGLPNRLLFMDRLGHAIKKINRSPNEIFAVLFLDIDRFKLVNDSFGHAMGDQFLIEIGRRIIQCLRLEDTVARLGGDEFSIILERIESASDATRVAERIQFELAKPFQLNENVITSSASIGITLGKVGYSNAEEFLRDADSAMYRAKATGKARYEIFDSGMQAAVTQLLQFESELRQAIESEEFEVYYQPLVSLATGMVVGTEALLRWQHPQRGLLPPAAFISVLEETGMIVQVGEWVLRTACKQNKAWQDAGNPQLRIAVNFSARQFALKNLPDLVNLVLDETDMDARTLELEITESTAIKDVDLTITTLNKLNDLGVGISLDDFGSGYSALSYLKRYPFQTLKADRSFIMDIPGDSNDSAITAAIIAMAHSLKIKVVAEGVETQEQLDFLHSNGCDEVQGFLFSKPVPTNQLTKLLGGKSLLPVPGNRKKNRSSKLGKNGIIKEPNKTSRLKKGAVENL